MSATPDQIIDDTDPGDSTGQAFRFQYIFAAITCCGLLNESSDITEVFCEHHEDVLVKKRNGKFVGIQVKTRGDDQPVWKTSDEQVKRTLERFVTHDKNYPDSFDSFKFLTNHPLHNEDAGTSLTSLLSKVKEAKSLSGLATKYAKVVKEVARSSSGDAESVFRTFAKTEALSSLPKKNDIMLRLKNDLVLNWPGATNATPSALHRVSEALASACHSRSTLAHVDDVPLYLMATSNSVDVEHRQRIDFKRITRACFIKIIEEAFNARENLGDPYTDPLKITPGSEKLLELKLDAGGLSITTLNSAIDLKNSVEYLGQRWLTRHGAEVTKTRLRDIRSQVLRDASVAFENTKQNNEQLFGAKMLHELRLALERRASDAAAVFNCTKEHLEGFAFQLSSECAIDWSLNRPWEAANGPD